MNNLLVEYAKGDRSTVKRGKEMDNKKIISVIVLFALVLSGCKTKSDETASDSSVETSDAAELTVYKNPDNSTPLRESKPSETELPVNDTTAPVILSANSSVRMNVGDIFDANNYISYIDDYDREPKLTMESEVDTTVAGTYETAILVTDASGNQVRKSLTVRVVGEGGATPTPTPEGFKPSPTPTPAPKTIPFDEFVSRYNSDSSLEFGIDVSRWQSDVDYNKVKAAGCSFVIIKAGTYYKDEFVIDAKFEQNLTNAKAAGLKVGLYFYTPVTSEEILRDNVDKICEALGGRTLDLPVAYDMETWSRFQQYKINLQDLNGLFYAFCDQLEQHGYSGMLYNSKNKLETVWDAKDHPVWLAHYTRETTYEGDYILWQVNNIGRIDGINGDVDLDIFYPDRYKNG